MAYLHICSADSYLVMSILEFRLGKTSEALKVNIECDTVSYVTHIPAKDSFKKLYCLMVEN
jgi:hypothetical protein